MAVANLPNIRGPEISENSIIGMEEIMGTVPFLNRLKSAENEWYEVFSEYVRQRRAQKDKKTRTAKIFRRTDLLVRAAISYETLKREAVGRRSSTQQLDSGANLDGGLPEGNDLVGCIVQLTLSDPEVRQMKCIYLSKHANVDLD